MRQGISKVKFHYKGFNAVRRDPKVVADLNRRAQAIAAAAGPGFIVKSGSNPSRAWASVAPDTTEAKRAEAEHKALTRAIDAGKG